MDTITVLRWAARMFGAGIVLFSLTYLLAGIVGPTAAPVPARDVPMFAALGVALLGMLVGWVREMLGGILVLAGLAAFYLVDYAMTSNFPSGLLLPVFAFPGMLYVIAGAKTHHVASGH